MITRYEEGGADSDARVNAVLDFLHMAYANALAAQFSIQSGGKSYYCLENAQEQPTEEMKYFIAWAKLKSRENPSFLERAMVTTYPAYTKEEYPLSECNPPD